MDRLARALKLVDAFRTLRELRTADVMRILEVGRPVAMRYLESLVDADVPIAPLGTGRLRRWVVTDPNWKRVGVPIAANEVFALHFGRQLLGFVEGTSFSAAHDHLHDKLKIGTTGTIADLEEKLARRFVLLSEPYRRYGAVDRVLDAVVTSLLWSRELETTYGSRSAERSWTNVRPLALVVYRRALYLLVRLGTDRKVLRLAVERIRTATVTARDFTYPRDFDASKELERTFGIYDDHRARDFVRMRFVPEVTDLVTQRVWHRSATVEVQEDGSALLTMHVSGRELVRLALEWGPRVEVLEPAWLREEVQRELREALERYR